MVDAEEEVDRSAPVDARRALGRRPGAGPPVPRVQIYPEAFDEVLSSPLLPARPSPTDRHISITIPSGSPNLPAPPSPTSPSQPFKLRRPTISRPKDRPSLPRGVYETQKLLGHLLERLEQREPAPDLLDCAALRAREASSKAKGKGKRRAVKISNGVIAAAQSGLHTTSNEPGPSHVVGIEGGGVDEVVEFGTGDWDTDETYDLVEQTRNLLVLSDRQGLDLFSTARDTDHRSDTTSPTRTKRTASRFTSFTGAPSPHKPLISEPQASWMPSSTSIISTSTLLSRLLECLRSLIAVDCLHRTRPFRPLRPPNALQAACLDMATFLYHKCDVQTKVDVMDAVIPGFYGMGEGMTERICEWIEGRLGELLVRLAKERGVPDKSSVPQWSDPPGTSDQGERSLPTFAISSDFPTDDPSSVSTPGLKRVSPNMPSFLFFDGEPQILGLLPVTSLSAGTSSTGRRVASLVPRILGAIVATIDQKSVKLSMVHRVHRLVSLVLRVKPDAYLDLLEIVAYGADDLRRTAVELLSTFFSESMGHNIIARRLATSTYSAHRSKWETGQERVLGEDITNDHHYIPWRISSEADMNWSDSLCSVCDEAVHEFCVRCTLCDDMQHLKCHEAPDSAFHYDVVTLSPGQSVERTVTVKFSRCPPRLDERLLDGHHSTNLHVGQHEMQLCNLFTLTLCDRCHEPLWGVSRQAYACMSGCQRLYHRHCAGNLAQSNEDQCRYRGHVVVDEIHRQGRNPFIIQLEHLAASFQENVDSFCPSKEERSGLTYDELAILHGSLWTQYQIYHNGCVSGSMQAVSASGSTQDQDPLGLREALTNIERQLEVRKSEASSAMVDFISVSNLPEPLGTGYMFSKRYLTFCTALLRNPSNLLPLDSPNQGLLTVDGLQISHHALDDRTAPGPYEMIELSTLTRSLASDLNVHDKSLVALLLDHLRSMGLLTIPTQATLTVSDVEHGAQWASFGLPLLMNSSPAVELLILAVEALLDDLDLSMNEQGLSLLTNRAWPSPLCSPYALERLASSLISWVMARDESLHQVVRLYASKHKRLPGVRLNGARGVALVAAYQEDRSRLLQRYALPWLADLHDMDPITYAAIVYGQCRAPPVRVTAKKEIDFIDVASEMANLATDRMILILEAHAIFSIALDLLTAWFEDLGALVNKDVAYKALPRLLRNDGSKRSESGMSDFWAMARTTCADGSEGVERVCRWFRVLSFSGVDIPWEALTAIIRRQGKNLTSIEAKLDLIIAVNANGEPLSPASFAEICCQIFMNVASDFAYRSTSWAPSSTETALLLGSLTLVLRAYGVSSDDMSALVTDSAAAKSYPSMSASRRKRSTVLPVLLPLDIDMVLSAAALIRLGSFRPEILLDFFWLLFSKSTAADNVDGFLYKISASLYPVLNIWSRLWNLTETSVDRVSRMRVLLRLIAVDPKPLEILVKDSFRVGDRSETRERLLRIILDLADKSVTFENTGWAHAVVGMITLFFDILLDHSETGPDSLVILKALLPAHLRAITFCLEQYMIQGSDETRLALLTRLQRWRMALPNWPVLSWSIIDALLAEQVATLNALTPARTTQSKSALLDAQSVRASLLAVSLDMAACGIQCDWTTAQRIQQHVAAACVVPWTQPTDYTTILVLPALRQILDSSEKIRSDPGVVNARSTKTALVGSVYVAVVIEYSKELQNHDFIVQRSILDIIMVVFFKHNIQPVELAALSSLQSIARYVATAECVENRLLAIQILQIALQRVEKASMNKIVPSVFSQMSDVMVKELRKDGDPVVVEQSRALLLSIVKTFGRSGLFIQVLRIVAADTSSLLGQGLQILYAGDPAPGIEIPHDSLLDFIFADLLDILRQGRQTIAQVLVGLQRVLDPLEIKLTAFGADSFGTFIGRLTKHVADWNPAEVDADSALQACASVLRLAHGEQAMRLLPQITTFLHLCLSRFSVSESTTRRFLCESGDGDQSAENKIRTVLFEVVGSAVHGLAVTPMTLTTLLAFLNDKAFLQRDSQKASAQQAELLPDAAPGCISILLRQHATVASSTIDADTLTAVCSSSARVLLRAEMIVPGTISRSLGSFVDEAVPVQLGAFAYLLLAAADMNIGPARGRVASLYPLAARAMSLCVRAAADFLFVDDTAGYGAELLSTAFATLRLALLAAREPTGQAVPYEAILINAQQSLWSRVWPDWYRLLTLSFQDTCINGPLRAIAHSVFLDMIIFLANSRSPLLDQYHDTLSKSLRVLSHHHDLTSAPPSGKIQKATRALQDSTLEVTMPNIGALLQAITSDLKATQKLRALRAS